MVLCLWVKWISHWSAVCLVIETISECYLVIWILTMHRENPSKVLFMETIRAWLKNKTWFFFVSSSQTPMPARALRKCQVIHTKGAQLWRRVVLCSHEAAQPVVLFSSCLTVKPMFGVEDIREQLAAVAPGERLFWFVWLKRLGPVKLCLWLWDYQL